MLLQVAPCFGRIGSCFIHCANDPDGIPVKPGPFLLNITPRLTRGSKPVTVYLILNQAIRMQSDSTGLNPAALKVLSKTELITLLCRRQRVFDDFDLHKLWEETKLELLACQQRAREGVFVDEASGFARWVQFSGLLDLFKVYPQTGILEVSEPVLRTLVTDVLFECDCFWKKEGGGPWVARSEVEKLNHKLDVVMAQLGRVLASPETSVTRDEAAAASEVAGSLPPALRVIAGGAS